MHDRYMQEALTLARKGLGRTSPNPAVGAVLMKDGEIVGRGFHVWSSKDHAEIVALREAGELARGATLYVTLEPCNHTGRTSPCVDALIAAGVIRVVTAMKDPNPLVAGKGLVRLQEAGIETVVDQHHTGEAEQINEPFLHSMRTGKPLVTLKSALTLDGKIAAPEDNSGWITSEKAREHVQQLRYLTDCILTGIGTVVADDCLLTDRSGLERSRPLMRIVADSQLRIPLSSKMVASANGDLIVACTSAAASDRRKALEKAGVEVLVLDGDDGRTNLQELVVLLGQRQYRSLMVEAGSKVNWAFLEQSIADKIYFYYAPKILGGMQSLPVAGGVGRRRRADAIRMDRLQLHAITAQEFAVEAWVRK